MIDFSGKTKEETRGVLIKLWLRQLFGAVIVFVAGFILSGAHDFLLSLILGLFWGLFDNALILYSTVRGFGSSVEESRKLLVKTYFSRLSLGVLLIGVMLGMKLKVAETFIGFLALHICLIFNLKIFTDK